MAGVSRLQYASEIRFVRVMCSGRISLDMILHAFLKGQDGVMIGGCRLGDCNYITQGNFDALANTHLFQKIMDRIGIDSRRLHIEFMSGGDGNLLAKSINGFTEKIRNLGPLGKTKNIESHTVNQRLKAVKTLIPFIKLAERGKLRVADRTEDSFLDYYNGVEFNRLFDMLIGNKLLTVQILQLLRKNPLTIPQLLKDLQTSSTRLLKSLADSTQQGLIKYDSAGNRYMLN